MDITLKQLEVFSAVARLGNLTRASSALYMTKGAVSQALQELERKLGVQLFDRAHPRLVLNHEGRRLLPMADEVVHRAADIEQAFMPGNAEKPADRFLSIGCTKTIGVDVLPQMLAAFNAQRGWLPQVDIGNTHEVLGRLEHFELDAALLEGDERLPGIIFEPWLEDEMLVILPPRHPLADGKIHRVEELSGERWIVREPDSGSREYLSAMLARMLGPFDIILTLSSPTAIVESVSQGLGVALVSKFSAAHALRDGRIVVARLNESFKRTFSLCFNAKKYHSSSMKTFLNFCRSYTPGHGEE